MSDLTFFGESSFKIKRPLITTNGVNSDPDPKIVAQLQELNGLLAKRIIPPSTPNNTVMPDQVRKTSAKAADPVDDTQRGGLSGSAAVAAATANVVSNSPASVSYVKQLVRRALSPKHVPPLEPPGGAGSGGDTLDWDADSLAAALDSADEADGNYTLSEFIDSTPQLSTLKYDFQSTMTENWNNLDYNIKSVLDGYSNVVDYLITYGFLIMGLQEVNGLANFLLGNRQGAKSVANYAIVGAARNIIHDEHLKVPHYNQNDSAIVRKIVTAGLTISSSSFSTSLQSVVNDYVFNKPEADLIDYANQQLGLPDSLKPQLIQYIKASPVKISKDNINYFLPVFAQQILGNIVVPGTQDGSTSDSAGSDQDFSVDYFGDDQSTVQVSRTAVLCAAQLFYTMVSGDELRVFDAVNYFTHKYLIRGGIEIADSTLRDDLQLYVFSNKFTDLRTNRINDRSRPAERQMFYRQVFNWGQGQTTEDLIINDEFPKLWKVLILESAKYIERAQISPNPNSFVSRQNVMQAVEDLQYNLSTHCTGMANVITPLIYAELNFVIQRILMHPEVLRQLVPQGGTWWRVVEILYMGMQNARPRSTVIYNKAKLGDKILRAIADYDPSTFEQDGPFSSFISDVDAYITTQSILQEGLTESLIQGGDGDDHTSATGAPSAVPGMPNGIPGMPSGMPGMPGMQGGPGPASGFGPGSGSNSGAGQAASSDEWAF
ncbi:MAG TPA: hypothetical protein VF472_25380 [Burkholderiaceae bacterium]